MYLTVAGQLTPDGRLTLEEPLSLDKPVRVLVTVLDPDLAAGHLVREAEREVLGADEVTGLVIDPMGVVATNDLPTDAPDESAAN